MSCKQFDCGSFPGFIVVREHDGFLVVPFDTSFECDHNVDFYVIPAQFEFIVSTDETIVRPNDNPPMRHVSPTHPILRHKDNVIIKRDLDNLQLIPATLNEPIPRLNDNAPMLKVTMNRPMWRPNDNARMTRTC